MKQSNRRVHCCRYPTIGPSIQDLDLSISKTYRPSLSEAAVQDQHCCDGHTDHNNIYPSEVSETVTINSNPEVNLANTNIPAPSIVGSTVNVSSSLLPGTGTGSGQQMTYSWTNSDDPEVFDIQRTRRVCGRHRGFRHQNIPDQGHPPSTSLTPTVARRRRHSQLTLWNFLCLEISRPLLQLQPVRVLLSTLSSVKFR